MATYPEKTPYQKKLMDPRWQKKRLEILGRDNFTCQRCGDNESTLHVHHRLYKYGKEPWDYENKILVTLCDSCHESESEYQKFAPKDVSDSFLEAGFFAIDFISIIEGLQDIVLQHNSEVVMSAYGWALRDKKMQTKIIAEYFKCLTTMQKNRASKNNNDSIDKDPF